MVEENKKQTNEKSRTNVELSLANPDKEFKSMIDKNLTANATQTQLPEALVTDKEPPQIVDTSVGADSPKKLPKDQN